jgi:Ca-activated chloride channel family protein
MLSRFILAGLCCLLVAFCLASGLVGAQAPAPQAPEAQQTPPMASEPIRRDVNLVDVLFTVFDKHNHIVSTLEKDDFKVTDDGELQRILFFSRQSDLPLRVGLLMDTSNSIRSRLKFEQEAAIDFLYTVIRRDKNDQTFLMTIEDDPQMVVSPTSDLNQVRDAILRQRAGGGTALYDAIYRASEAMAKLPLPNGSKLDLRRVLVVISDGDDTLSRHSRSEALDMAQRAGIVIYTISTSTQWIVSDNNSPAARAARRKYMKTSGDKELEVFADDSGGRAFFPYLVEDLSSSFAAISDELRNQYSLAYVPAGREPDGKFHKIRVQAVPKDIRVRARNGYYAAQPDEESAPPVKFSAPPA